MTDHEFVQRVDCVFKAFTLQGTRFRGVQIGQQRVDWLKSFHEIFRVWEEFDWERTVAAEGDPDHGEQ